MKYQNIMNGQEIESKEKETVKDLNNTMFTPHKYSKTEEKESNRTTFKNRDGSHMDNIHSKIESLTTYSGEVWDLDKGQIIELNGSRTIY